ncbi:hypothetical protein ILUMI_23718 [Ignelater luminosus]|uniref:Uncharacterized protein n=1 Tax=Ignelater luminosus TaxID=2038154 RepID=A0A8K0C7J6_IGNLU|nr:hypothetical protein ILUMI_23718 [Ignelater luminosus]
MLALYLNLRVDSMTANRCGESDNSSESNGYHFFRVAVQKLYDLLANVVDTHHLAADRIYNYDETGVSVNPKGFSKIIEKTERKQVGALSSGERLETVTDEIWKNYVLPMLIFSRKVTSSPYKQELGATDNKEIKQPVKKRFAFHGNNTKKVARINFKLPSIPRTKRAKKATPPPSSSSGNCSEVGVVTVVDVMMPEDAESSNFKDDVDLDGV